MYKENFSRRHIGPSTSELNDMLKIIGVKSIEDLLSQTIPEKIRLKSDLDIPDAISEMEFLKEIKKFSTLNFVSESSPINMNKVKPTKTETCK